MGSQERIMVRKIIPDRWLDNNANLFPSLATVQNATEVLDIFGGVVNTWVDDPDLIGLPCAIAPFSTGSPSKQETRATAETTMQRLWHVTIKGYHAEKINDNQRVQVYKLRNNGIEELMNLSIISTEQDSHSVMTRLECEVWSYDGTAERS